MRKNAIKLQPMIKHWNHRGDSDRTSTLGLTRVATRLRANKTADGETTQSQQDLLHDHGAGEHRWLRTPSTRSPTASARPSGIARDCAVRAECCRGADAGTVCVVTLLVGDNRLVEAMREHADR